MRARRIYHACRQQLFPIAPHNVLMLIEWFLIAIVWYPSGKYNKGTRNELMRWSYHCLEHALLTWFKLTEVWTRAVLIMRSIARAVLFIFDTASWRPHLVNKFQPFPWWFPISQDVVPFLVEVIDKTGYRHSIVKNGNCDHQCLKFRRKHSSKKILFLTIN